MDIKYKIHLNAQKDDELEKARIRATLKKRLILARILIIIYKEFPLAIAEIQKTHTKYFKDSATRTAIFNCTAELENLDLIERISGDYAVKAQENDDYIKKIKEKHIHFLSSQPKNFNNKKINKRFYCIPTNYSNHFIEWSCKILNLKSEHK